MGSFRLFAMMLLCCGCSDRVVDSRAYNQDGMIVWSTVMPSSRNTALWLRYNVRGPVTRADAEAEGLIHYDIRGRLAIKADGQGLYSGPILLRPEGPAVEKIYNKGERDGVSRSCAYSSCTETGRLKLMSLHETPSGAVLELEGSLPLLAGEAELISANLELAPN